MGMFILWLLGFKQAMNWAVYRLAWGWAWLLIFLTGCPLTVIGRENIPQGEGVCFVSNHQSIVDIVILLASAGRPIGFIAKKELAWIPFLDLWILLIGGLFIDRVNTRKAVRTIKTGIKRIKSGGAMIIFPEGRRSKGKGLLPFHSGSFKLATQADAPIVPVVISGSYEVFEKNYQVQVVPVTVEFCKPIYTAALPPEERRRNLSDYVYSIMKAALGEERPASS
jgi:1-acyl-sn-glycerol-3-phosphate acyltransferase